MSEKIRVGIIGLGNNGRSHARAYQRDPRVELYAVCDLNPAAGERFSKEFGVERVLTDVDEMLALPELDAVSVSTINNTHCDVAIKALRAGKNVLCEKPMATTIEDAEAMIQAEKESGKLLMVGFCRRFGGEYNYLKELNESGYFGNIYYAKVRWIRRKGSPGGWFTHKSLSGGGPLIDLGIHMLDIAKYICGNPEGDSVYCAAFNPPENISNSKDRVPYFSLWNGSEPTDTEGMLTALVRFKSGLVVSLETSFEHHVKQETVSVELFGDKAGAKVVSSRERTVNMELYSVLNGYMTDTRLAQMPNPSMEDYFANEAHHFIDCIADGVPCRATSADGLDVLRILMACYQSSDTKHEVIL